MTRVQVRLGRPVCYVQKRSEPMNNIGLMGRWMRCEEVPVEAFEPYVETTQAFASFMRKYEAQRV